MPWKPKNVPNRNSNAQAARLPSPAARLSLADLPIRTAIAVSGGGDSIALLLLALEQNPPENLVALTVDHALRPSSAAEAETVSRWCLSLEVEHHTLRWLHSGITTGIQAKARKARYDLMTDWCRANRIGTLLTAHTLEDQAETVSMRMARTQSSNSLAGIWPVTEWNGITIRRPLLNAKRQDLRDYLSHKGQKWIEDSSNSDSRFERVRVRNGNPSLNFAQVADESRLKVIAAENQAEEWLAQQRSFGLPGEQTFAWAALANMAALSQDCVVRHLIRDAGGTVPERQSRTALLLWIVGQTTSRRSLGGTIFIKRKREVIVVREPARIDATPQPLQPDKPLNWDNRFTATGPSGSTISPRLAHINLKKLNNMPSLLAMGLPVICLQGEILADPFFSHHPQAKLVFIKK